MAERFNIPLHQVFDSNGDPLSGAKLSFFVSGTSTPLDTFSDNALSVANANPVIADSAGRFGDIFLQSADYKVILKTSADVTIWTADPVHGGSPNPLFSSISVKSGNYTVVAGDNGKLIPVTASATITITAAATLGSNFRCGIVNAGSGIVTVARSSSDTFDAGQTSVKLAPGQSMFVQPDGTSKLYTVGRDGRGKGADIASASTLPLGEDGHYFHVTGTTTITALEARPTGWEVILEFDAALTLTHNATSLILPTGGNISVEAGDIFKFISESDGGNWRCSGYARAAGGALNNSFRPSIQSGTTHSPTAADNGRFFLYTNAGAITVTLPAASTLADGWTIMIRTFTGAGALTINRSSTDTIISKTIGLTTMVLPSAGDHGVLILEKSNTRFYWQGRRSFQSTGIAINAATDTQAHSLGMTPSEFSLVMRNTTSELGYTVGDEVPHPGVTLDQVGSGRHHQLVFDATNGVLLQGTTVTQPVLNKTTPAAGVNVTAGSWNWIWRAVVIN